MIYGVFVALFAKKNVLKLCRKIYFSIHFVETFFKNLESFWKKAIKF